MQNKIVIDWEHWHYPHLASAGLPTTGVSIKAEAYQDGILLSGIIVSPTAKDATDARRWLARCYGWKRNSYQTIDYTIGG